MTTSTIKVKVVRRPSLKLKVLPRFPGNVTATAPILLDRTGGNYGFSLDASKIGNIPASSLPNPTASTLGGVQSVAAVSHNWINSISTLGIPALSQPAFTDVSGQATLAQLPTLGANTVLGSIAGGTPIALSKTQNTTLINTFTTTLSGAVPNPGTVASKFLRDDGTWQLPPGSGTVTSITAGTGLSGGVITTSGTIALALTNATVQVSPSNPTATTSTTGVMMGLGTTAHITPVYSGRVRFEIIGQAGNATAANTSLVQLRFGTGTAPSNGAAFTGTLIGPPVGATSSTASAGVPFALSGIITGLSPGTAYWFDINLAAAPAGTASVLSLSCNAMEF